MSRSTKFISLAEHSPELLSEWHPTKNTDIRPQEISYGSAVKVWWKCAFGHEWQASPNGRTRGSGCPECAKLQRMRTKIKNIVINGGSLAVKNPDLAREWHPTKNGALTPHDVSINSSRKVWWQCPNDQKHEWDATISSRNSGRGCPICSGHRLVTGVNDLATIRPDLAAEWHPTKNGNLTPTDIIAGTNRAIWWQCKKGHEWKSQINNRISGNNCPVCIGKKVLVGYNDLATVMPNVAKEWHPTKNGELRPQDVTVGSNKKVWWKCEKGHEWQTSISHRSNGNRCPICFGESKTSFPEQAIFFYCRKVTTAYNRYMMDSKTEIDVYLPEYKIGIEYDGAFFHNGEKAEQREVRKQAKLNSLGITLFRVREIADQANEYTVYSKPGANDIELTQAINDLFTRIARLTRVSFEVNIDVARDRSEIYEQYIQSEKENSLAIAKPALAKEWNFEKNGILLPEFVSMHSNKKVWWKCNEGHEWQAVISSREKGVGCPYCAG